jgi:type I restriction enzyme M protein
MVDLMQPTLDDTICDPAMGTAGFLTICAQYLTEHYANELMKTEAQAKYTETMFTGFETDQTMLRIGAMNMMLHGVDDPNITGMDSLSEDNTHRNEYSLILANPPFTGSLDYETVSKDLLAVARTKKTELLFMVLFLKSLKIGGRCASIVPAGVLFGSSRAHKAIRKELVENNRLEAVVSMPSGVFKPYAGVSTAILIFTRTDHGGTDEVWFYDMEADGRSLDDKRDPIEENDIPDIVKRFHNRKDEVDRERTEKSFLVSKQEIVDNDYDLSVNKYKEVEYEKIEYPPTSEILDELEEIQKDITESLAELRRMLDE